MHRRFSEHSCFCYTLCNFSLKKAQQEACIGLFLRCQTVFLFALHLSRNELGLLRTLISNLAETFGYFFCHNCLSEWGQICPHSGEGIDLLKLAIFHDLLETLSFLKAQALSNFDRKTINSLSTDEKSGDLGTFFRESFRAFREVGEFRIRFPAGGHVAKTTVLLLYFTIRDLVCLKWKICHDLKELTHFWLHRRYEKRIYSLSISPFSRSNIKTFLTHSFL